MGSRSRDCRFNTIKRQDHRHGRISLAFQSDATRKQLLVSVNACRGLPVASFGEGFEMPDTKVGVRVQLLPIDSQDQVRESLFGRRTPKQSVYRKHTRWHSATANPVIQEVGAGTGGGDCCPLGVAAGPPPSCRPRPGGPHWGCGSCTLRCVCCRLASAHCRHRNPRLLTLRRSSCSTSARPGRSARSSASSSPP